MRIAALQDAGERLGRKVFRIDGKIDQKERELEVMFVGEEAETANAV